MEEYNPLYESDIKYEGMGLVKGILPVENPTKFTHDLKQKIPEYLKALGV